MMRLLIVDDRMKEAYVLARRLQKRDAHAHIDVCATAEEGLLKARKDRYDLILCDFKLPGISGLSFLKLSKELRPATPVMILTGYDSPELEQEVLKRRAYAFLLKPIEFDALMRIVNEALDRRDRHRAA